MSRKSNKHNSPHHLSNTESNATVEGVIKTYNVSPSELVISTKNNNVKTVIFDQVAGFDKLWIHDQHMQKLHPYPAEVFVVAGKYMFVPDYLFGPLKYASETINIEQLFIDTETNKHYVESGKKRHVLLTGSCASLTISAITIKFAEDMIQKYMNPTDFYNQKYHDICIKFRSEYDTRVGGYLCGKGIQPEIPWFINTLEKEWVNGPWTPEQQKQMKCGTSIPSGTDKANKHSTLNRVTLKNPSPKLGSTKRNSTKHNSTKHNSTKSIKNTIM